MKSILHDLYAGKVTPWERRISDNPKYKEIIKKLDEEEHYLMDKLPAKDVQHLQNFKKLSYQAMAIDEVEIFRSGYKLGALMMMEVLEDRREAVDE